MCSITVWKVDPQGTTAVDFSFNITTDQGFTLPSGTPNCNVELVSLYCRLVCAGMSSVADLCALYQTLAHDSSSPLYSNGRLISANINSTCVCYSFVFACLGWVYILRVMV